MLKFFVATHILLLFFGILLLFYYAKTGYRIDLEVMQAKRKVRAPKLVRLYAKVLLVWMLISVLFFFSQVFMG